jgi:hypothetical protein
MKTLSAVFFIYLSRLSSYDSKDGLRSSLIDLALLLSCVYCYAKEREANAKNHFVGGLVVRVYDAKDDDGDGFDMANNLVCQRRGHAEDCVIGHVEDNGTDTADDQIANKVGSDAMAEKTRHVFRQRHCERGAQSE